MQSRDWPPSTPARGAGPPRPGGAGACRGRRVRDMLDRLEQTGEHWTPVMRFAVGLLHADMRLAIRNIWSDGRTDDGPFPLSGHPLLAEVSFGPVEAAGADRR